MVVLLSGLLFFICLPAEFRTAFFHPATLGERLLTKSFTISAPGYDQGPDERKLRPGKVLAANPSI